MNVKKITAVLLVNDVERCVTFWQKLGFQKTVEVPDGNKMDSSFSKRPRYRAQKL